MLGPDGIFKLESIMIILFLVGFVCWLGYVIHYVIN